MKIVVIEGLDKAGKHTAAVSLERRLHREGVSLVRSEFHRYETPTGNLVKQWLIGQYDVDQKTIELIMAADKQAQQAWFNELEEQGVEVLILDRYVCSQLAYAIVNGSTREWTGELQRYMRPADHTILIDIPPEVSMARTGKHNNGENDRYESNLEMLRQVRAVYRTELEADPSNIIVDGEQPLEEIHRIINDFVVRKLKTV